MNKIKCYINDNYIDVFKNNKIIHLCLNSIDTGNIIDYKTFIKEIKKDKIFSSILTYSLELYLNKKVLEEDIIYYKIIFEELNCKNIVVESTDKYLENNTLIVNNKYYILYTNKVFYYIEYPLLKFYTNYFNIKKLKIISNIKLKEIDNVKFYYFNYPDNYFIK